MSREERLGHLVLECDDPVASPGKRSAVRDVRERHRVSADHVASRPDGERTAVRKSTLRPMTARAGIIAGDRETGIEEQATAKGDLGLRHRIVGGHPGRGKTWRRVPCVLGGTLAAGNDGGGCEERPKNAR